jgi:hypothetical protein
MALHKDPRTGIYQYRKTVPEALRPFFGKREFKVTLETRDEGEARIRMLGPAAAYEREAELARSLLKGGPEAQALAMVRRWLDDTGHCPVAEFYAASKKWNLILARLARRPGMAAQRQGRGRRYPYSFL